MMWARIHGKRPVGLGMAPSDSAIATVFAEHRFQARRRRKRGASSSWSNRPASPRRGGLRLFLPADFFSALTMTFLSWYLAHRTPDDSTTFWLVVDDTRLEQAASPFKPRSAAVDEERRRVRRARHPKYSYVALNARLHRRQSYPSARLDAGVELIASDRQQCCRRRAELRITRERAGLCALIPCWRELDELTARRTSAHPAGAPSCDLRLRPYS